MMSHDKASAKLHSVTAKNIALALIVLMLLHFHCHLSPSLMSLNKASAKLDAVTAKNVHSCVEILIVAAMGMSRPVLSSHSTKASGKSTLL